MYHSTSPDPTRSSRCVITWFHGKYSPHTTNLSSLEFHDRSHISIKSDVQLALVPVTTNTEANTWRDCSATSSFEPHLFQCGSLVQRKYYGSASELSHVSLQNEPAPSGSMRKASGPFTRIPNSLDRHSVGLNERDTRFRHQKTNDSLCEYSFERHKAVVKKFFECTLSDRLDL